MAFATGVSWRGLNRAGAEYGSDWDGWTGQAYYAFPTSDELAAELDYATSRGFNILRLPIAWERLQHDLLGDLDPDYISQVMAFVDQANAAGLPVIVDLHNYNRYASGCFDAAGGQLPSYTQHVYGDGSLDVSHLVDVWTKLATACLARPAVIFNLMNEPHDFPCPADAWFADVQSVIDAIRATGAAHLILVPNSRGSDVDHWYTYAPNGGPLDSLAALGITDSASNIAFDMHAYQDTPSSPTSYVDLLRPVTEWAASNQRQLFLSELGVVNGAPNGAAAIDNLLGYLDDNAGVWLGWTAWNLAPYNLTEDGTNTLDGPQMAWYAPHLTAPGC